MQEDRFIRARLLHFKYSAVVGAGIPDRTEKIRYGDLLPLPLAAKHTGKIGEILRRRLSELEFCEIERIPVIFRDRREPLHKGGVFGFQLFDFKIKLRARVDFFVNLAGGLLLVFSRRKTTPFLGVGSGNTSGARPVPISPAAIAPKKSAIMIFLSVGSDFTRILSHNGPKKSMISVFFVICGKRALQIGNNKL